jgi:HAD superfamily hydrolase (TIGR01509 family)
MWCSFDRESCTFMRPKLVIFDFDGVIADSEALSNQVLANNMTAFGFPTSYEQALERYMGRRWDDCLAVFKEIWDRPAPETLRESIEADMDARSMTDLRPVKGVSEFLQALGSKAKCIGSSSTPDWIERRLELFGFSHHFKNAVFSAAVHVARGKPHPDIYLHAAKTMGAGPRETLVIEDSPTGVAAGVSAGMTVIGLCAGSHIRPGHDQRLRSAGAHHICTSYAGVSDLIAAA